MDSKPWPQHHVVQRHVAFFGPQPVPEGVAGHPRNYNAGNFVQPKALAVECPEPQKRSYGNDYTQHDARIAALGQTNAHAGCCRCHVPNIHSSIAVLCRGRSSLSELTAMVRVMATPA